MTSSPALPSTTNWWRCSGATRGEVVSTVNPAIEIIQAVHARHAQHSLDAHRQGVVAAARQVDALDGLDARHDGM